MSCRHSYQLMELECILDIVEILFLIKNNNRFSNKWYRINIYFIIKCKLVFPWVKPTIFTFCWPSGCDTKLSMLWIPLCYTNRFNRATQFKRCGQLYQGNFVGWESFQISRRIRDDSFDLSNLRRIDAVFLWLCMPCKCNPFSWVRLPKTLKRWY